MVAQFSKYLYIDRSNFSLIGLFLDFITKYLVCFLGFVFVSKISLKARSSLLTRDLFCSCLKVCLSFFLFHYSPSSFSSSSPLTFSSSDACSRFLFLRALLPDFLGCYTSFYFYCVSFWEFFYCYTFLYYAPCFSFLTFIIFYALFYLF